MQRINFNYCIKFIDFFLYISLFRDAQSEININYVYNFFLFLR